MEQTLFFFHRLGNFFGIIYQLDRLFGNSHSSHKKGEFK